MIFLRRNINQSKACRRDRFRSTFSVESTGIESGMMNFKFTFDNPLMVSTGTQKDKMVITIVDGSFFANEDGMPVPEGT